MANYLPCRNCLNQVAPKAANCPNCGADDPTFLIKREKSVVWFYGVVGFLVGAFVSFFISVLLFGATTLMGILTGIVIIGGAFSGLAMGKGNEDEQKRQSAVLTSYKEELVKNGYAPKAANNLDW